MNQSISRLFSSALTKIFNIGVLTRIIIYIFPLGFQFLAPLAQLAEHRTLNPQVPGSIPGGPTILTRRENVRAKKQ